MARRVQPSPTPTGGPASSSASWSPTPRPSAPWGSAPMRWQWRCQPRCWEGECLVLSAQELDEFFERHFHRRAFRLEVRDAYEVASDGGDFARYIAGEALPDAARKNAWL